MEKQIEPRKHRLVVILQEKPDLWLRVRDRLMALAVGLLVGAVWAAAYLSGY